ncbi:MAG: lectin [Gemmatimonadaceae bacterium]
MLRLTRVFVIGAMCVASSRALAQNAAPAPMQQPPQPMTFFITSAGPGDGANLGGLAGADAHCGRLAQTAGVQLPTGRVWRAYLSGTAPDGKPINARDRIGSGPWHNQKGALIAATVADLHGDIMRDRNSVNKEFALNEKGLPVNGRGDTPNQHDILTGSDSFGRALAGTADWNCANWTSSAATGAAMVGHHDRSGGGNSSWNAAHLSRGCGQPNLVATGGAGLFYCFGGT